MTSISYILVFGVLAALSASAIWALWWAMKTGQFARFQEGASSIFDKDEPVGSVTDTFPKTKASGNRRS